MLVGEWCGTSLLCWSGGGVGHPYYGGQCSVSLQIIGNIDWYKKIIIISSITVHKIAELVNKTALIVYHLIQTVRYASAFKNQFEVEASGL